MSLFLCPKNRKLLLVHSAHIQVKFRDYCVVWHLECDIKRKEEVCPFVDCLLCSPGLDVSKWPPPAIRQKQEIEYPSSAGALFLTHGFFSFPSSSLPACLPFFLSSLPPQPSPCLPSFTPQTSVTCPACAYMTKAQWKKFHENRFISWSSPRTGGPHPRNSDAQLALALADFLRQNLKVPDSQISKTQ